MYVSKENFKNNNFNAIQFVMALFVIYSHSFSLGAGTAQGEVIKWLTSERLSAGSLAVSVMFIISGYLVSASYDNSKSVVQYLKNRIFRVYPALITVVVLSTFVIGPCVTTLPLKEYFANSMTYQYLRTILLRPVYYYLPGVFEGNVHAGSVNGALWTLPYQCAFYLMLGLLGLLGLLKHKSVSLTLFVAFSYAHLRQGSLFPGINNVFGIPLTQWLYLGMYFTAGMTAYAYRDKISLNKSGAMTSVLLLLFGWFIAKEFYISTSVFGTYIILYLAYCTKQVHFSMASLSYGIYIFGFPVQQLVTNAFGGLMSPYLNMIIATPVVMLLAWLCQKYVESPALKLKKYFTIRKLIPDKAFDIWEKIYGRWMELVDKFFEMSWIVFAVIVAGALALWCVRNL